MDEAGISSSFHVGITDRMASYLTQSRADNTVKKYRSSFKYFGNYCVTHGLTALPAQPISVAMYLTFLMDEGKSNNVISSVFTVLSGFIL
jgi:site-specific recombinase XerD